MRFAFLFGAGASRGAGSVVPVPPPLGAELYDSLRIAFPKSWGALDGATDTLFRRDFELGMNDLWASQATGGSHLLIEMARYFTQFDPSDDQSDLYSQLTRVLIGSGLIGRTAIASLNYECILEVAASRHGLKVAYLADDPPPGNMLIWKPHGSCNVLPTAEVYHLTIVATNIYEGQVRVLDTPDVRALYDAGYALPPAMSLFAPGKPTPVAKTFVSQARTQWAAWVARSDFIAIVGARPVFADNHIWDPIVASRAQLWYIGGATDFEALQDLAGGRAVHVAERFADGFADLERKLSILA
jgi:hypothetical protein